MNNGSDYLENIFQSVPQALVVVDKHFLISLMNSVACSFFSVDNAVGRNLFEIAPFLNGCKNAIDAVFTTAGKKQIIRRVEVKKGELDTIYVDVTVSPVSAGENSVGALIIIDDVTEQELKEQYIRRSQKMDMVGTLAAGLAHDFNNVINGIKATVSAVKFSLEKQAKSPNLAESLKDDIEIIEESANRGTDIIEQLLSISRKKELPLSVTDLGERVMAAAKVCRNTLPKNVELSVELPEEKAPVNGYPTQLEQVLLNLMINAAHAMTIMRKDEDDKGGLISVSLKKIFVGPNMCGMIPEATPGFYWLLSVSDQGIGMTKEIMAKIFDPFFTTKEKRGTGLGLSMVYNIVREHKGFIDVFSNPGEGSVFFIFIPVIEEKKHENEICG